jgi:4-amino-4-deoxy-L-arabinose transferase-like glycosyltransferase
MLLADRRDIRRSPSSLFPLPFSLLLAFIVLIHLTLLRLPYFWDEGGYYIPAALDFYHHGWLVPHFTNAHPPLPNVVLGTLWHLFGFHILVTRLIVCAFAAAALLAVLRLAQSLLGTPAAIAVTLLTAVYPIWYAQSTLAHADIFAAAFTLWAFALYIPTGTLENWKTGKLAPENSRLAADSSQLEDKPNPHYILTALLFSLAALSKETSILQPATLAALELFLLIRNRHNPTARREHLRWLAALSFPLLPLIAWYAYHHHVTGFTFGNPEYLRYNATANLTLRHILTSIYYRFLHLFWQRNIWLPIVLALACLFLQPTNNSVILSEGSQLYRDPQSKDPDALAPTHAAGSISNHQSPSILYSLSPIPCLIASNWLAFSVLGGALLTRYLLPIYPLILILCVALWQSRTKYLAAFTAVTAAAFISAWWLNPPTSFAPEDNLTYRDMIVVHQQAIDYVADHYPQATVLTAWPVAADLFNPYLGYVKTPIKAVSIEDFTLPSIRQAADDTRRTGTAPYDTAIVFTTHFLEPSFRRYLLAHPDSLRGRQFAATRDLSPEEIAALLGGHVVTTFDRHGEWAAVLRFDRSYEARLTPNPR